MASRKSDLLEDAGQGTLFDQRAKRSRMARPRGGRGPTNEPTPGRRDGRRGAEFVADPATIAEEQRRAQLTDELERIALIVGFGAGAKGFALWQLRDYAVTAGVLTDTEGAGDPRALSWLGALLPGMARRGLAEKVTVDGRPQYDTSAREGAHGNKNILWKLTADGRTASQAMAKAMRR